jgi:hypothetical protein
LDAEGRAGSVLVRLVKNPNLDCDFSTLVDGLEFLLELSPSLARFDIIPPTRGEIADD